MDFLRGKLKPIYFKYLGAAFGSALITSIYAITDTAMDWTISGTGWYSSSCSGCSYMDILYSMGLLMGIGGSVIFSNIKENSKKMKSRQTLILQQQLLVQSFLQFFHGFFSSFLIGRYCCYLVQRKTFCRLQDVTLFQ